MTFGLRGEARQVAGDAVVEAGAESDQQIRLLQRGNGSDRPVHAGHPEVLRVAVGERAPGHQGGDDRDAGELGQLQQLLGGVCLEHPAAHVEHRPLGRGDQLGGLTHLLGVRAQVGLVAGQVKLLGPGEGGLGLQDVLGQIDQHRTRTAGGGDVERLGDGPRDVGGVGDEEVVLRDRQRDAADVGFLEGVAADGGAGHLAGDRDHRDAVHVGVGDRRDQVSGARARGSHANADPAGGLRISGGSVTGALLVAHQDVADRAVEQRVVRRQDRSARDTEDDLDPGRLERANE